MTEATFDRAPDARRSTLETLRGGARRA